MKQCPESEKRSAKPNSLTCWVAGTMTRDRNRIARHALWWNPGRANPAIHTYPAEAKKIKCMILHNGLSEYYKGIGIHLMRFVRLVKIRFQIPTRVSPPLSLSLSSSYNLDLQPPTQPLPNRRLSVYLTSQHNNLRQLNGIRTDSVEHILQFVDHRN